MRECGESVQEGVGMGLGMEMEGGSVGGTIPQRLSVGGNIHRSRHP